MLVAVTLVAVVILGVVIAVHGGPHGLGIAGVLGLVVALGLGAVLIARGSLGGTSSVLLSILAAGSLTTALVGARSVLALRGATPARDPGRLWGADGIALTDLDPYGAVRVGGESWSAESLSGTLRAGDAVHVAEVEGLHLRVWSAGTLTGIGAEEPPPVPGAPVPGAPVPGAPTGEPDRGHPSPDAVTAEPSAGLQGETRLQGEDRSWS